MKPFKLDPTKDYPNGLGLTREEIEEGYDILARTNEDMKREAEAKQAKKHAEEKAAS